MEIAKEFGRSPATVRNQYEAAFEMITGYPYRNNYWIRIFGVYHSFQGVDPQKTPRRFYYVNGDQRRSVLTVPMSLLNTRSEGKEGLFTWSVPEDEVARAQMLMDIETLLKRGRSPEQVAEELELQSNDELALLSYVYDRLGFGDLAKSKKSKS